jgi:tRNA pseudouridine-54 N-methylase
MITVISRWEFGWLDPSVEAFMWKQLTKAYKVDQVIFAPTRLENRLFPIQKDSIEEAIASAQGKKVFLIPGEGNDLASFEHPDDAVYIFGNAMNGNQQEAEGEIQVQINTPAPIDFFAINAAAIVLYDRRVKDVS